MTHRPYISCRQLIGFLADYLAMELSAQDVADFERHLEVCPSCVAYLDTYRETLRIAKESYNEPMLFVEEAPNELIDAVLAVVKQ